ncbi:NB-ARC [Arabidopsis thaliana x Arabidopsis arenosa]|uniref:ADP-ribosyl cyclase/cyclic ADP-ribose hydrolase n=1 Tax=Arabidopsis thaliana x Arabidopsis arenosa TaxID=1240361 RepID=A0A8T2ASD3_9BRAS|nr:NB-ARC [Arabidopsis thaliana x Arabidopsis arenosa]
MEFQRKGITPFIDNEIKRGESIGPELIRAIRGSKIAIILLSRNYASSSWCLDELAEIMKCREELGQTVMAVFYKVDPSHVKKLTGDFGEVFRKTCASKTNDDIGRWRQALAKVATIAGYHSSNWDNEAAMISKIATDISNKLNNSASSSDFDGLVGMRAHFEKMEPLLCLDSDEVRMIGICGPSGIGKTTIARVAYNHLSNSFQLSVFMENIKEIYTRPCSDDYSTKLCFQKQFMSQITNQKDIEIPHLGVAQDRLKDKKVLVVLDGVDQLVQLDAMVKETWWFGPGSRIIITTQDQKLFRVHGINHIYKVDFPATDEALQILCMHAFGQKFPKDGFEELAREVTRLAGKLPLGLRVMGSYFRRMSKQEWTNALPKLRTSIDTEIESILKFSYDVLDDGDKDLFLHIACIFNYVSIENLEAHLAKKFLDVRQGLNVLAEKSLISIHAGVIIMHNLLAQLGRDIVRKQSVREPGQRQFLVDSREICELLTDDAVPLRNLRWMDLSSSVNLKELPDLSTATNLQQLDLEDCSSLMKLPSTIGYTNNLKKLDLRNCSSLINLPSSIRNATNLEKLYLGGCSSLVEFPSTIGNVINLQKLDLSSLSCLEVFPFSIANAINLQRLDLSCLSCLVELPSWIGNATNLEELDISHCSNLVELPVSIGNLQKLQRLRLRGCSKLELTRTAIEEVPPSIRSWSRLDDLHMSYCESLRKFPHALDSITELYLSDTEIQEIAPWIKDISRLDLLLLKRCRKLVSLPPIPDSLSIIDAEDCESLERLDCFFPNTNICLIFAKCFKLNQEARDLIIQTPTTKHAILPGGEVPAYFTHRATTGGFLTIKLSERPLPTSMRFKACILLVNKVDDEAGDDKNLMAGIDPLVVNCKRSEHMLYPVLTEHLYIFEVEAEVTSSELVFEFKVNHNDWKIGKCGVVQLLEVPSS